jgi:plasmid stabilization system protein ParE
MKVVIAAAAKADLVEIGEYIHSHNPVRAVTFVDELLDRCDVLADMPGLFHWFRVMRNTESGRDYLIFYRAFEDLVEVIHILHGARNYEALLFPDESVPTGL